MTGLFDLWEDCEKNLKKYFVYDKVFDLLFYDQNLDQLKQEIKTILPEEPFAPNYRLIFLHYDTDYYLFPNTPGILLTNLQIILQELNVPNYFCLIVSNHNNLSDELEYLRKNFTKDDYAISNIFCQLQNCHVSKNILDINVNAPNIEYHYSCFNHSPRSHRHTLVSMLKHFGLLDKGLISYVNKN